MIRGVAKPPIHRYAHFDASVGQKVALVEPHGGLGSHLVHFHMTFRRVADLDPDHVARISGFERPCAQDLRRLARPQDESARFGVAPGGCLPPKAHLLLHIGGKLLENAQVLRHIGGNFVELTRSRLHNGGNLAHIHDNLLLKSASLVEDGGDPALRPAMLVQYTDVLDESGGTRVERAAIHRARGGFLVKLSAIAGHNPRFLRALAANFVEACGVPRDPSATPATDAGVRRDLGGSVRLFARFDHPESAIVGHRTRASSRAWRPSLRQPRFTRLNASLSPAEIRHASPPPPRRPRDHPFTPRASRHALTQDRLAAPLPLDASPLSLGRRSPRRLASPRHRRMTAAPRDARAERTLRSLLAALPDDVAATRTVCARVDDWEPLLASARAHGVGGVVLAGLRRAEIRVLDGPRDDHERLTLVEDMRQAGMRRALASVLDALAKQGVANVALKGPLLAARLYASEDVRPSTDLDLLLEPSSLEPAAAALAPLGYVLEGGATGRFYRDHHHHVHAIHRSLPLVELHFDAYRGFGTALPAAPLLERSSPCLAGGFAHARVLSPEDEWLYLAVHGASHRFERLCWLYDLKLFGRAHPDLRWEVIAARAREWRLSAVVSLTARLLVDWLGTAVRDCGNFAPLGDARALAAEQLSKPLDSHLANAVASVAFAALLCEPASVAAFGTRYLRMKLLHEMPLRARAFFAS